MAFHFWSVPLFVVFALIGIALVIFTSRKAKTIIKVTLSAVTIIVVAFLVFFAWWVNQGDKNSYGEVLFRVDWGVLIVFICVVSLLSVWFSRKKITR